MSEGLGSLRSLQPWDRNQDLNQSAPNCFPTPTSETLSWSCQLLMQRTSIVLVNYQKPFEIYIFPTPVSPMKIISKYIKFGNHKIFLKLYLFIFCFSFYSRECLHISFRRQYCASEQSWCSGKEDEPHSIWMHTQRVLSTYIDIDCFFFFNQT